MSVATHIIDYPEALAIADHLRERDGIEVCKSFEATRGHLRMTRLPDRDVGPGPFIVINGSSTFHHETLPLVRSFLDAIATRIAYIQIDAHPDKETGYRWLVACGSFVGGLLEDDRVHDVHLLGLHPDGIVPHPDEPLFTRNTGYYRCDLFSKLHQYLGRRAAKSELFFAVDDEMTLRAQQNPAVRRVRRVHAKPPGEAHEEAAIAVDWRTLRGFDPDSLPDLPVYLSIDLDVCRDRPVTDWRRAEATHGANEWGVADNQGVLEWPALLRLIRKIGRARTIAAADFCGITYTLNKLEPAARAQSLEACAEIHRTLSELMA